MKRTPAHAALVRRSLRQKTLLIALTPVALPALVASAALVAASDSPQAVISESAVEELTARMSQIRSLPGPTVGAVANVEADAGSLDAGSLDADSLPTEVRYLMSAFELDAEEAVAQLATQKEASVVSRWLTEELHDEASYGGSWIDHSRGGRLVVAVTDSALGREIVAVTSDLISIETKVVQATESDLEAIFATVTQRLDLIDKEGRQGSGVPYYTVSVELQKGRVVIGQSSLAPDGLRRKSDVLARNPLIFIEDLGAVVFERGGDACPLKGCSKELGGISAYADGGRCSTGFTASQVIGGLGFSGYLLSGGHCGADNADLVRHGNSSGPIMGTQIWERDSGSVDASIINNVRGTMIQDQGNIWRPEDSSWPIYGTQSRSNSTLGNVLCRVGYRGEACGQLISKTISRNGNTNVGRLEHTSACPGDSGGPVFDPETHLAVGLHQSSSSSANCTSWEDSYFTFISELQAVVPSIYVDIGR